MTEGTPSREVGSRRMLRATVAWVLTAAVQAYRLAVSPVLGPACRYEPSCSAYAIEAIGRHGPWRGAWLAARRVLRCHPLRAGGYDPVPREVRSGP
jgi:putative membrane protein insertion efficiency factor